MRRRHTLAFQPCGQARQAGDGLVAVGARGTSPAARPHGEQPVGDTPAMAPSEAGEVTGPDGLAPPLAVGQRSEGAS